MLWWEILCCAVLEITCVGLYFIDTQVFHFEGFSLPGKNERYVNRKIQGVSKLEDLGPGVQSSVSLTNS